MEQYIQKSALVAEIEKLRDYADKHWDVEEVKGVDKFLDRLCSNLDTLEVKEVGLDFQTFAKEMDAIFVLPSSETKNTEENPLNWEYTIAKHFYELGLKAKVMEEQTMTDKQKIKEEIERLRDIDEETSYLNKESFNSGRWKALTQIKAFIDSLLEETASEDLKEAAYHYANNLYMKRQIQLFEEKDVAADFIAGAEWQRKKDQETIELAEDHAMLAGMNKMKEEMMKDAVEAFVNTYENTDDSNYVEFVTEQSPYKFKETEKCKIIIVKED